MFCMKKKLNIKSIVSFCSKSKCSEYVYYGDLRITLVVVSLNLRNNDMFMFLFKPLLPDDYLRTGFLNNYTRLHLCFNDARAGFF